MTYMPLYLTQTSLTLTFSRSGEPMVPWAQWRLLGAPKLVDAGWWRIVSAFPIPSRQCDLTFSTSLGHSPKLATNLCVALASPSFTSTAVKACGSSQNWSGTQSKLLRLWPCKGPRSISHRPHPIPWNPAPSTGPGGPTVTRPRREYKSSNQRFLCQMLEFDSFEAKLWQHRLEKITCCLAWVYGWPDA